MPIQKWEYHFETLHPDLVSTLVTGDHTDEVFKNLGATGWELVSITVYTKAALAIFKRPKQ